MISPCIAFVWKADIPRSDRECGPSILEGKGEGLINMPGIVKQSHVVPER
jgi:hypothetical protein